MLVQWLPPSVGNGDIVNYTVKYNSPLDQQSSSSVTTLDDSTFLLITGLKPYTMYYFTVHAMNSFGLGPGSEPGYNRTSEEGKFRFMQELCKEESSCYAIALF